MSDETPFNDRRLLHRERRLVQLHRHSDKQMPLLHRQSRQLGQYVVKAHCDNVELPETRSQTPRPTGPGRPKPYREKATLPRSRPQPFTDAGSGKLDQGVTGDTFADVKTISIKQLHAETGRWVRAAKKQMIVVTDRGEKIATLQPHVADAGPSPIFSLKARGFRPKVPVDSTIYISEDRDSR